MAEETISSCVINVIVLLNKIKRPIQPQAPQPQSSNSTPATLVALTYTTEIESEPPTEPQ